MKKLSNLMNLSGKTVFITGGAGYLGTSMSHALAELGANIVIGSRDGNKCKELAKTLENEYGIKAMGIEVNILDVSSIASTLKILIDKFGTLDILINNAWSGKKNTFESISYDEWNYDINMCLNAVFYTTKEASEYLKASKGVIVNITSMYGHVAPDYRIYDGKEFANPPSYGAAKAGVIQLTKYLASFLSPYGVRVNALSPGPFPFPETQKNNDFIEKLASKNMLNRIGQPEDLKGAIALLCSDASSYMTGQNICVDGGWAAW
ncbi:MAG: SDR family oxidoreductase [Fusobacteriaceae bacterium]|jgi:NAD(P)-dependent dehydrogenase (short-subunit alcohol dehydrogenase family)|nr:SDR family oxidoreductase [Fusobacteriaceae bacterium]